MEHSKFSGLLRAALNEANKTQQHLADFFETERGISKASTNASKISHWNTGQEKEIPTKADLWTIANFFATCNRPVVFPLNAARACFDYPPVEGYKDVADAAALKAQDDYEAALASKDMAHAAEMRKVEDDYKAALATSKDEADSAELRKAGDEYKAALSSKDMAHAAELRKVEDEHKAAVVSKEAAHASEMKRRDKKSLARTILSVSVAVAVAVATALLTEYRYRHYASVLLFYDFEGNHEMWGRHSPGSRPSPGDGVKNYCDQDPRAHSGRCSLEASLIEGAKDILVGRGTIPQNTEEIEAYVTTGPNVCIGTPLQCSTAKVFVLDAKNESHQGDSVELGPGWRRVQLAVDERWPTPFQEMGVLVFAVPGFKGPVYVDAVTLR